jgi:hypothetical protein
MAATLARRKTAGLGVGFPTALFSGGGKGWKKKSKNLAAQIHHLIRKRFYHLNRKIILA